MTSDGKRVEVIFDVETKKFFDQISTNNPADLGISIVSAYRREIDSTLNEIKGEMRSFWTTDAKAMVGKEELFFDQMWSWFDGADRIIGYNSLGFDVPAVNGVCETDFSKLKHFDVLKIIKDVFGHRVKLDSVAKETLGQGKIASGGDAVMWWSKGDPESMANLKKYCEMDVEVTMKVYDYGLKNKSLKFKDHWNEIREIEVDFSYPAEEKPAVEKLQMGLF
jgi:DEAD/DEAH box helicase domain-containing protein